MDMKLLTFLYRYNNWIGFRRKLRKGGAVVRGLASFPGGGGGGYSLQRLLWVGSDRKGYLFMLQVYERVGLLLVLFLAERFFSGCSGFPLSPKTNRSKFQIDPQRTDTFKRVLNKWENKLQIKALFIYFLEWYFGHVKIDVAVWPEWILNLSDIVGNIFC